MAVAFDPETLYTALDRARRTQRLSWRELSRRAHVDHNAVHRLAYGTRPDVDNLTRLLVWLGNTDIRPYITKES